MMQTPTLITLNGYYPKNGTPNVLLIDSDWLTHQHGDIERR